MKKLNLTRVIASTLIAVSAIALNPVGASAEWRRNSTGWWYSEGNSYLRNGWNQIGGKWYYFDFDGYITQNAWMYEGYYLNSNGEWTGTSKYRRNDILKNGFGYGESGDIYSEAGDQSDLDVINGEPCIYTWNKDDKSRFIGMNTLTVYDAKHNKLDKVMLGAKNIINSSNAVQKVSQYLKDAGKYVPSVIECDHEDGNSYVIHCYDVITYKGEGSHTATSGWYYVDKTTGNISLMN